MPKIKDILEFMRIKICVFAVFLSISGYFMFNTISYNIIYVVLASFFLCAGTYAYNNIADKKEDLVNRGKINDFSTNRYGNIFIVVCFFAGILFSMPLQSFLLSLVILALGIAYTSLRIKNITLAKNLYTGFGIPLLFLVGASGINTESIFYYIVISFFFFICSLISDIRDYNGDKKSGIPTLPVRIGYNASKIVALILLFANLLAVVLISPKILPIGLFSLFMAILIIKSKIELAHTTGGISLIVTTAWILSNAII